MKRARLGPVVVLVSLWWASAVPAREVLTPEEQAERELEVKKKAPPVLVVEPAELALKIARGETRSLRLTVRNAGGGKLSWSVLSAPRWARPDKLTGELGFDEKGALVLLVDPGETNVGPEGGTARGEIVIEAPGVGSGQAEGSPAKIALAIEVPAGPRRRGRERGEVEPAGEPVLECSPAEIEGTLRQGGKLEFPLTVRNAGGGKMNWHVSKRPEWIAFDVKSGELTGGDARRLFLIADAEKLRTGALEDEIVIESSRGTERVASVPVRLKVRHSPSGFWALQPTYWRVTAHTEATAYTPGPAHFEGNSRGFGGGFQWVRTWEGKSVDYNLEIGLMVLDLDSDEGDDATYERTRFSMGFGLAFPSGSKLKGYISTGIAATDLVMENLGGSSIEGDAQSEPGDPYFGAGIIYALGRRFSIQAHLRYHSWFDDDAYVDGFWDAEVEDASAAFGIGLAVHY